MTVSAIALADEARGRTLSCRTLRLLVLGMAQIVRLTCPARRDGFLFF